MMKPLLLLLTLLVGACTPQTTSNDTSVCTYDDSYTGKSADECSRVQVLCIPGYERFDNECGCGCKPSEQAEQQKTFCQPEQREADVCIALYQPVCGWFDPEKIQCIKYPCANTYSNSCAACKDEDVQYWTDGECPQ